MVVRYLPATVIHSNKYNQNSGFYIFHFFFSRFYHDLVFKLVPSGEKLSTTLSNVNVPLYVDQDVRLIAIDDEVIGYIDGGTNNYYYITNNLKNVLGKGFRISWGVVFAVSLALTFLIPNGFLPLNTPLIFFLLPMIYWFYLRISNYLFEKKIDQLILQG